MYSNSVVGETGCHPKPLTQGGMDGMALWYRCWVLRNLSVLELDEVELASPMVLSPMFGSDTMCRSCVVVLSLMVVRIVCAMFLIVALAGVIWRLVVMR